jgi:hypothetical protein
MDDGKSYLRRDFSVQCLTSSHLKMALAIGLPYILIWVIGTPAYFFIKLYKNRKNFDDKGIITNFGLFFVGLNDKAYFWEIIITNARKITFIICSTLLSTSTPVLKALLGVIILFVQMQLLHYYVPYIDPRFNNIEHLAIYASIFTVFSGLFFLDNEV